MSVAHSYLIPEKGPTQMTCSPKQIMIRFMACSIVAISTGANTGCGSKSEPAGSAGSSEAQGKMSPEDVQKELQKISPPSGNGKSKGKAKAK